ncbi:transposase [Kitasatospora sp. NPDC098663]|uniref:transposase n=1 Tax=Kitasatospora sp. NPDC098663 TaxID=3364096 RepID=UPI003818F74E
MLLFFAVAAAESSPDTLECDCLAHRFGNAGDNGMRERRYPTDMSDAEWAVVRSLPPVPGWLQGRGGQPEADCHRTMLDAIHYLVDNGIKWRATPGDFQGWRSEPRSPLVVSLMATSVGSLMTGSGTLMTRTSRLPCQVKAFIITPRFAGAC